MWYLMHFLVYILKNFLLKKPKNNTMAYGNCHRTKISKFSIIITLYLMISTTAGDFSPEDVIILDLVLGIWVNGQASIRCMTAFHFPGHLSVVNLYFPWAYWYMILVQYPSGLPVFVISANIRVRVRENTEILRGWIRPCVLLIWLMHARLIQFQWVLYLKSWIIIGWWFGNKNIFKFLCEKAIHFSDIKTTTLEWMKTIP